MTNTTQDNYSKFDIVSIDAWRDEYSWFWNNKFSVEKDVCFLDSELTPRKILKAFRKWGFLTEHSKGKLSIEKDEYCITIINKNTFEPLFAMIYQD